MTDEVYRSIAQATSGYVEAPAGCGKTEAIVRTVGAYCEGRQLVLTHTHAGVDALRQRFRKHSVPNSDYHVDTIAGWSWGWVRKYPDNAGYAGSTEIAEWNDVYAAMQLLLQKEFVQKGILNSYTGIIVDEYQDCTVPMHQLIVALKALLPCRVLGDDLQGIFGFRDDPLVSWPDVTGEFLNNLGSLDTPYRWMKAGNEPLGRWLLGTRSNVRNGMEPDYRGSPIDTRSIRYADLGALLVGMTHDKEGRICVIGPKARPLAAATETMLVNQQYRVLEPNELSALRDLVVALSGGAESDKSDAAIAFLVRAHGGLPADDRRFIERILRKEQQSPRRADRQSLCQMYTNGATPQLLYSLLHYIENIDGTSCKLRESVSAFKCIAEEHFANGNDLRTLYAEEIRKRKYQSRSSVYRCVGSTLLVKGLEFDHAIILRTANWQQSWGGHKDLYVALTRGSSTATLIDVAN